MATEQEILDDLEQSIANTNRSNDDFLKVLKLSDTQDVSLRDGTVVPSLAKRVKQASLVGSEYNVKSENLADVPDKEVARGNLSVYSKSEVDTNITDATIQATELVKGQAKIATTAIAQIGVNDTDFLTAKKLRSALNATGTAPISACRAFVVFSLTGGVVTIKKSFNVSSVVRNSVGNATINFTSAMQSTNYCFIASGRWAENNIYAAIVSTALNSIKTTTQLQVVGSNFQNSGVTSDLSEICVAVFE